MNLHNLFHAKSIAVVGASATPGKVGYVIMNNLLKSGYKGKLFAVNPKHKEVLGVKCYAKLTEIPEKIEMAIIAVPAKVVPAIVEDMHRKGIEYFELVQKVLFICFVVIF